MIRSRGKFLALGLAGACALLLAAPRAAEAGKGVSGTATVQPAPDPWIYTITNSFTPFQSATEQEFFHTGDSFTITGFGALISFKGLTLFDDNFSLTPPSPGATSVTFTYDGPDLFTPEMISVLKIDTDTKSDTLVVTYSDHIRINGVDQPNPDHGPNVINVTSVPEPSSIALLGLGAAGGLYFRRRMALRRV